MLNSNMTGNEIDVCDPSVMSHCSPHPYRSRQVAQPVASVAPSVPSRIAATNGLGSLILLNVKGYRTELLSADIVSVNTA
jgi:hypothetical protein